MSYIATAAAPERMAIFAWLDQRDTLSVVAVLTLGLCTFFGFDETLAKIPAQLALLAVLVKPDLLKRTELWAVLATCATIVLVQDWSVFDNHKYLLVYWLWVMTAATYADRMGLADKVLRSHARFFLVFVFLAAAAQKIFSPTYMSGEMFEIKLLLDQRFAAFAHLIGIDYSTLSGVRVELLGLKSVLAAYPDNSRLLSSTDYIRTAALAITWYDLLVQIAIGALFLPARRALDMLGHAVLLFFVFTTYLPAPVFGFGWLLSIYGLTLARGESPLLTKLYLASFIAILLYQAPWREWVLAW